jgi:hypothetical protein
VTKGQHGPTAPDNPKTIAVETLTTYDPFCDS